MKSCIFCKISNKQLEATRIYEDEYCFAILDKFPLSKGHLLVIPHQHQEFCNLLDEQLQLHLNKVCNKINQAILASELHCSATNILINNGRHAGQHIQHVHWHIIPRYKHDTIKVLFNFLTRFMNPFNYQKHSKKQTHCAALIKSALNTLGE